MNLQPFLTNDTVTAQPLKEKDFEKLFAVASDPLVWEQHPNKNRYKREVFLNFFEGAMQSGGAFLVTDTKTGEVAGSSRFYDYEPEKKTVSIGYTFLGRKFWGGGYNAALKKLMLGYAFQFVEHVVFHVGAKNIRSQKAMEKTGAKKIAEMEIAYYGEDNNLNFIYRIDRTEWVLKN